MPSTSTPMALRCCLQLASRTQRRSLLSSSAPSSQCLRLSSTSSSSLSAQQSQRRRRNSQASSIPSSQRWQSTDATAASNPKISGIVDQISQLTLLETADLVASLKSRLNIPDISFGSPMATGPGGAAAAPAEAVEDEPAPAAEEKTMFTLKLQSFEPTAKPKIIKEVKSMLGLSLVDSKKFVESAPKVLKEGVSKEEAEKIVATLKALGGVVVME